MNVHKEFALEPGEEVIREVRIHWFFFLGQLLPYVVLFFLPFAIPPALRLAPELAPYTAFGGWGDPIARAALGTWWLLIWSGAFNTFTRYFLNVWILTNDRIVDVFQKRFFNREVSSLFLNRVEDVTITTDGIMDSLLNIGTINVQTAGTHERFAMDNVPEPQILRDLIMRHVAEAPHPRTEDKA